MSLYSIVKLRAGVYAVVLASKPTCIQVSGIKEYCHQWLEDNDA